MNASIVTDNYSLARLADQQCGRDYWSGRPNVMVERGDSARWSNRGNLVVEHNWRGTEDVCRDGYVVSRNQPLHGSVPVPPPFPYYPQPYPSHPHQPHGHQPYPQHPHHDHRPGIVIRF
jgi:hypothetical protein